MKKQTRSPKFELYRSGKEDKVREEFWEHFKRCPIPGNELMANLGLFLSSKNLARILCMQHLYEQIVDTQGVIMEFGTRWGQNLSLFAALRGIYEPFNRHRKIIGFDTFEGFLRLSDKDAKNHDVIKKAGLRVSKDYDRYLAKVMEFQESDNPMSHLKKFDIRKGDVIKQLPQYLRSFPETVVSLAYFDLDLYEPTKACLKVLRPHLVKGSILAFDEVNDHDSPGETIALKEVMGLNAIRLKRYPHASRVSYFVVE